VKEIDVLRCFVDGNGNDREPHLMDLYEPVPRLVGNDLVFAQVEHFYLGSDPRPLMYKQGVKVLVEHSEKQGRMKTDENGNPRATEAGIAYVEQYYAEQAQQDGQADHATPPVGEEQRAAPASEAVYFGGKGRSLQVGSDPPFSLPLQFAKVLEGLLDLGGAADTDALDEYGGGVKKLKMMLKRFPQLQPCVTCPGGKAKGGYRTSIRDGRKKSGSDPA
jgi:hypothetical protein